MRPIKFKAWYKPEKYMTYHGGITIVEYWQSKGGFRSVNVLKTNSWALTEYDIKTVKREVIGNIYENKELLK